MASWLASAAATLGFVADDAPPTPKGTLTPAAVEAGLAEMERLLAGSDTEALLRAGGEQGLPPVGRGLGRPTLERWLRAEKGDAASAAARLKAHAVWRAEYVSVGNGGGRGGGGGGSNFEAKTKRRQRAAPPSRPGPSCNARPTPARPPRPSPPLPPPPSLSPRCPTARSRR